MQRQAAELTVGPPPLSSLDVARRVRALSGAGQPVNVPPAPPRRASDHSQGLAINTEDGQGPQTLRERPELERDEEIQKRERKEKKMISEETMEGT